MINTSIPHLIEYRCSCGKLLFKGNDFIGQIQIKCRRCGRLKLFGQPPGTNVQT